MVLFIGYTIGLTVATAPEPSRVIVNESVHPHLYDNDNEVILALP
jgi:hypothetical protein